MNINHSYVLYTIYYIKLFSLLMNDFFFSSVLIQILLSKLKFSRSSNIKSVLKKICQYCFKIYHYSFENDDSGFMDSKYGMLFGIY